ncbi:MAG: SBBP repeat-containing protein [Ignavibacteriae bacterium]|nr:SBBP repeat-containing protein [Ignavibacteriota bacterium]
MKYSVVYLSFIFLFFVATVPAHSTKQDGRNFLSSSKLLKQPLLFEENKGQTDGRVKFLARSAGGVTYFFTEEGVTMMLTNTSALTANLRRDQSGFSNEEFLQPSNTEPQTSTHVLKAKFVGGNTHPSIVAEDAMTSTSNYFIGNNRNEWKTNIPNFGRIRYKEVYPGIDVVYYGNGEQLEYDLIVQPGADPSIIRIHYEGIGNPLALQNDGDIAITTNVGMMEEKKPYAYQEYKQSGGQSRNVVAAEWTLLDNSTMSFALGAYDRNRTLCIDPLLFSTFVGTSTIDETMYNIDLDNENNIYVSGRTRASDFPVTPGAYDEGANLSDDVVVMKFETTNYSLVYSTYIGGSGSDHVRTIYATANHSVIISGLTNSTNFPTQNSYQSTNHGANDFFITRLNASGTGLTYSTYVGGSDYEGIGSPTRSLAVDTDENVYIVGETKSSDFPATVVVGSGGDYDAFVFKLNATGSQRMYGTRLGGTDVDWALAIVLDGNNHAVITGDTRSANFPTTLNAYDRLHSGVRDIFISKIDDSGNIEYSTFLGGTSDERGRAISLDSDGNVYVSGWTTSIDFPHTTGAYDENHNGSMDVFISKLNSTLSTLVSSTFYGGGSDDYVNDMLVDANKNVYLCGVTLSPDLPTTPTAFSQTFSEVEDVLLAIFKPALDTLAYGSFLGGNNLDEGYAIRLTQQHHLWIVGRTASPDYPVTLNAFDSTYSGNQDMFITELELPVGTSSIAGTVFYDFDGDGNRDPEDYGLANQFVALDPTPYIARTDSNGAYLFQPLTAGSYTVRLNIKAGWNQTKPLNPSTYPVNLAGDQTVTGKDFGVKAQCNDSYLSAFGYISWPGNYTSACCDTESYYHIIYKNDGCNELSGAVLSINFSPFVQYKSYDSDKPVTVFGPWGNILAIELPPLRFGEQGVIILTVRVKKRNCDPQKKLKIITQLSFFPRKNGVNNKFELKDSIACSFDPNDLRVSPRGCGSAGLIARTDSLTYSIRFQNTGSAPAHLIVVKDTIDEDLDLSTLQELGSSHPYLIQVNGREVSWIFPDIELPDSSTNEPESHGVIMFQIKPINGLTAGTAIDNRVGIYFDNNEVVLTNPTLNTITDDPVPVASFTTAAETVYVGEPVNFTYTGGTTDGTFLWTFADSALPDISTEQNPSGVLFETTGAKCITLEVSLGDCQSEPASMFVYCIERSPDTITAIAGEHGTISPSGNVLVIYGSDQTFNVVPDSGYYVDSLFVDNEIVESTSSYTFQFVISNHTIRVVFRPLMSVTIPIDSRWNIVSVPIKVLDYRKVQLFPTAYSDAYAFRGTYLEKDTLVLGDGYWIKFTTSQEVHMIGRPRTQDTIAIRKGWNLIGALSETVTVSSVTSIPPGLVTSQFFGYNRGYMTTETLEPGKGYWVNVTENGQLILSAVPNTNSSANRIKRLLNNELPPIPPDVENSSDESEEPLDDNAQMLPGEFTLEQNYPNPFNPTTVIRYQLPVNSTVTLKVYDILGREVTLLVDGIQTAGYKSVEWNAGTLASGFYFYRIVAQSESSNGSGQTFTEVKKTYLLR